MNTEVYKYKGSNITFQLGNGDVMVDATQMAKAFGKKPSKWLELPSAKSFLLELQGVRKSDRSELIHTINGIGTWFHEDVALEFARWLSPSFAIWCNDKIKVLLTSGQVTLNTQDPLQLLKLAVSEIEKRDAQIALLKPKAEFMDRVMDADEKIDIGQAAKILELPFGRNTMFKKLREKGVFFKNKNEPKQAYINKKYFVLKEKWISRNNHDSFLVIKVLVTQKGLEYLSKLFTVDNMDYKICSIN